LRYLCKIEINLHKKIYLIWAGSFLENEKKLKNFLPRTTRTVYELFNYRYKKPVAAVKYAILFLIVPFLTLFLLEVFTKNKIHPVPYLLSGIANIIFYLLILSLSEQMPFFLPI